MGRSKKTKTTRGDSPKSSPSDWMSEVAVNVYQYRAYAAWIRTDTHEGLGGYRSPDEQEDECDREQR